MLIQDFIKRHSSLLGEAERDQIISHFQRENTLSRLEEEDFLQMKEVLDAKILEKLVNYLYIHKPFAGLEDFETLGEVLRYAQQCCFIYGGRVVRELQLACSSLSMTDKTTYAETKDPLIIRISEDGFFSTQRDEIGPRNILNFLVFVKGDPIEINFTRTKNKIIPNEGDLIIIPSVWTQEFEVQSKGISHIMLYRIAVDPSRYEIIDF